MRWPGSEWHSSIPEVTVCRTTSANSSPVPILNYFVQSFERGSLSSELLVELVRGMDLIDSCMVRFPQLQNYVKMTHHNFGPWINFVRWNSGTAFIKCTWGNLATHESIRSFYWFNRELKERDPRSLNSEQNISVWGCGWVKNLYLWSYRLSPQVLSVPFASWPSRFREAY